MKPVVFIFRCPARRAPTYVSCSFIIISIFTELSAFCSSTQPHYCKVFEFGNLQTHRFKYFFNFIPDFRSTDLAMLNDPVRILSLILTNIVIGSDIVPTYLIRTSTLLSVKRNLISFASHAWFWRPILMILFFSLMMTFLSSSSLLELPTTRQSLAINIVFQALAGHDGFPDDYFF